MKKLSVVRIRALACVAAVAGSFAAPLAGAQQTQPAATQPPVAVPPQVGDFRLQPTRRIVDQPQQPAQPQPAQPAQPQPQAAERQPEPTAQRRETVRQPAPRPAEPGASAPRTDAAPATGGLEAAPSVPGDVPAAPPLALDPAPVAPAAPTAAPGGPGLTDGPPLWIYLLGGLALGLVGYAFVARRRAAGRRALALPAPSDEMPVPQPQAPRAPRPDPVPRPWLEVELTPERTTAGPDESVVEFELCVRNSGGSIARGVKLQAKLICSTPDQDKEIAAFHRKKPGEHRTLDIPDLPPGQEVRLKGQVDIKGQDIKVMKLQDRLIFIPLVAINAFYEWGTARSGQTSKSFLVGREKTDPKEKMAPFRLDLGPRIYRTVGQRPYSVERRI